MLSVYNYPRKFMINNLLASVVETEEGKAKDKKRLVSIEACQESICIGSFLFEQIEQIPDFI